MRVLTIPADEREPQQLIELDGFRAMQEFVGGYVEIVRPRILEPLNGVRIVMVVNEEGWLRDLPYNPRASRYYRGAEAGNAPGLGIAGDAFLVGEGMVETEPGLFEPDFVDFPETADGPGEVSISAGA